MMSEKQYLTMLYDPKTIMYTLVTQRQPTRLRTTNATEINIQS